MSFPSCTPGTRIADSCAKRARSAELGGVAPIMPITMKGAGSNPVVSSPSASTNAAPGAMVRTFLKLLSSVTLNGSKESCSSTGTSLRVSADANIWRTASSV